MRRRPDVTTVELIGGTEKRELVLLEHDPCWAATYAEHGRRISSALGPAAVQVEHIGSTSVPGLAAKPIIVVLVVVDDLTVEEDYLLFRDRLRSSPEDRELYERTKRALVEQDWPDTNAYADAKTEVVEAIKERARRAKR